MTAANALMLSGVSFIEDIQIRFQNFSGLMVFLSHVGDPRFAFIIYFPVAYILHRSVGIRVMWACVVSEWLNAVLKWLLHGERPYWWIHQPDLYPAGAVPQLRQFNITCETGPGSPSGHAMITSTVWYILVSDFLYYRHVQSTAAKLACWSFYLALMVAVSMSRLFIAAHFPHQVIAGVLTGIVLGRGFNSVSTSALRLFHYLVVAVGLVIVAAAIYSLLQLLGVDPLWSVSLAVRWCAYKEWIHLDTTVFFALVRDVSSLMGLGIGLWLLPDRMKTKMLPRSNFVITVQIALALAVSCATESFKPFHDNVALFYTLGFIKHCVAVVCIVAGISLLFDSTGLVVHKAENENQKL